MKHLKKFNEDLESIDIDELIENVEYLLLNLVDKGFDYKLIKQTDIEFKMFIWYKYERVFKTDIIEEDIIAIRSYLNDNSYQSLSRHITNPDKLDSLKDGNIEYCGIRKTTYALGILIDCFKNLKL